MKQKLHLKKSLVLMLIGIISTSTFSQTNVENFDYPEGTLLTDPSIGFQVKASTPSIDIFESGLTYSGLAVSNIGKAAHIAISEDEDADPLTYGPERIAKKPFFGSSVNSGTVYMSFLGNIKSTIGGDYNNFFIALSDFNADRLRGRVMAKDDGSGNIQFGFSKGYTTSDINWTSGTYSYNSTYLFVVKYEFIAGSDNDETSLFIFEQAVDGFPASEPVSATLTALDASSSDLANIKIINLRQRKVETVVDGIALGTSWSDVVVADGTMSVSSQTKNQVTLKVYQKQENTSLTVSIEGLELTGENQIKVYNINGQLVAVQKVNNQNNFTLNTAKNLPKGIYIINIEGAQANYSNKFIIK